MLLKSKRSLLYHINPYLLMNIWCSTKTREAHLTKLLASDPNTPALLLLRPNPLYTPLLESLQMQELSRIKKQSKSSLWSAMYSKSDFLYLFMVPMCVLGILWMYDSKVKEKQRKARFFIQTGVDLTNEHDGFDVTDVGAYDVQTMKMYVQKGKERIQSMDDQKYRENANSVFHEFVANRILSVRERRVKNSFFV
jgi:hypothetical protein